MGKKILWIAAGLFLLFVLLLGQLISPDAKTGEGATMSQSDRAARSQQQQSADLQRGEDSTVQR